MAIEVRDGALRHRCTNCKSRWYPDEAAWVRCANPVEHPCPKCSKPTEPEPAKVECGHGCHVLTRTAQFVGFGWRWCPRCGVALATEGA